ncbi:AcrR family transcriptional regulator [Methanomicrobium sp. W14]|uniref:TetR/AcrR family transcriptional regulator n=1 Tax=Methanomicrobium sp. W14 TaxID=2817839 RepID=UPI001AE1EE4A|nr:TetR/AcrR family transcriptional regulator [Methanomicrobium sp. W14]MBP2132388.1 AcrR family transcriptional regulator [Methanomicrobium sp. W14]
MPKVVPEYKEEARKKIIDAGLEVMSKKGYCSTTMDDIASHLGVSKGALYLYFKNKDELVAAIVENFHIKNHDLARETFPTEKPLKAWYDFFDRIVTFDPEYSAFIFEIAAMAVRNDVIRESYSDDLKQSLEMASNGIACQQRNGLVRSDIEPRTLAVAIIAIFSGIRTLAIAGVEPDELRERWITIGKVILGISEE